LLDVGGARMNRKQSDIAKRNFGRLVYDWNADYKQKSYSEYVEAMCA